MSTQQPGWLPDPTGRHEQRYWDGRGWTDHVADRGIESLDPMAPRPPAGPPPGYTPSGGGMPPPGYGFGPPSGPYGAGGGPPRRSSKVPLIVAVVVLLLAAGGGAAVLLANSGGEDDEKKREYVAALAEVIPEGDDGLPVSSSEAECLAEAEVDIIGLGTLSDAVTPEEIRENPEDGLSEWGIEPSSQQGLDLLDAMRDCVEDLGAVFAESFLADMPSGVDLDTQEVGDCLVAGFDDEDLRMTFAESMFAGEDEDLTEDQANVVYDWISGCIDFRALFVDAMAQEVGADVADCIGEGITDDWLRGSLVAEFTGDETAEEELDAELQSVVEACVESGTS